MKVATVKMSEIENSPTLCMSSLRYVGECYKCNKFKEALIRYKDIDKAIGNMKCNPVINKEIRNKILEYRELVNKVNELRKEVWQDGGDVIW